MLWKTIRVKIDERAVVMQDGLPVRALGPGRHLVWGSRLTELRWSTRALLFESAPQVLAVLPLEWWAEVSLGPRERGILYRDGQARLFLRPGTHRYWTVDPSVHLEVLSVDAPMPELTAELASILPAGEHVLVTVREHERGLKYVQGRLAEVLPPGRWAYWTHPGAEVDVLMVDMRRVQVALVGQELMTRDKVTLRLSLTAEYSVEDPALATHAVASVRDAIYLVVQLAARQFVAGVTLDELLEGRDAMTRWLEEETAPKARAIGVRLERVGLKDIVLPGEMKTLLNRVIEAEKEAAANVILRREETAAMRSLANTARVMAEQPVLLRLKELEALRDIAERIQEVRVVVGSEGLANLLPAGLLGGSNGQKQSK